MDRKYSLYEVNQYETFIDMLTDLKEKYGRRDALVTFSPAGERETHSFANLCDDALALSAALHAMGLAGKTTAIVGGNSYRYVTALFGVVIAGGVAVTIDTEHADATFEGLLRRVGVEAVFSDEALLPLFTGAIGEELEYLISLDGAADGRERSFQELVEAGRMRAAFGPQTQRAAQEKDRLALIVFTSGTTSAQKPVMLSQYNLMTNACGAAGMVFVGERVFTPLPLYHTYGLSCGLLGHISQGRTVGLCYSLKSVARDLLAFSPHMLTAVPLVAEMLYMRTRAILRKMGALNEAEAFFEAYDGRKYPDMPDAVRLARDQAMGPDLCRMSCGGARLNGKVLRDMAALGVQILEGYGITECGPMVTCNRNEAQRWGSVGLPLPGMEVMIRDEEILVRGPGVSKGYYMDEALTGEAFRDGWFYTGDLGTLDADGYLFITGRKKNLIVFKNGKKVAPEEIEEYVSQIPLIREVVAYGASAGASDDDVPALAP